MKGRSFRRDVLTRVAIQVLFQGELPWAWNGTTAQRATKLALSSLRVKVPPSEFRAIVSAAYRLGRQLEPLPSADETVPWDVEPLSRQLCGCLFQGPVHLPKEAFLQAILNRVKCAWDMNSWKTIDWVQELNKLDGRAPWGPLEFGLKEKLEAAWEIEGALDRRRDALIDWAEAQQDVRVPDLVEAMETFIAENRQTKEGMHDEPDDSRDNTSPIGEDEIGRVSELVHEGARGEFIRWLKRGSPHFQRLVHRRVSVLEGDPALAAPWVKRIVAPGYRLAELRLVCGGSHYRVLFREIQQRRPQILAFGLRRDLFGLVEKAKRLCVIGMGD